MRYILLNKDVELLAFNLKGTLVDEIKLLGHVELLPEILKSGKEAALQHWLSTRGIDTTRTNARVLLSELRLKSDRVTAVVFNKGLNMTDCYWIKDTKKDGEITFSDISLYRKENIRSISALSLSGRARQIPSVENHEITNIGSFNKAWVKESDEWWLYKSGSVYNNYAELFAYYLGQKLHLNMATYKYEESSILGNHQYLVASLNFTNEDCMLEHYDSFRYRFEDVELEDDEVILSNMEEVGLGEQYREMLIFDALVANTDRHEFNFGILKSTTTGEIIGFAPYFDHNLSLNAHLNASEPIGLGLLKMCIRTLGKDTLVKRLSTLNMKMIEDIDQRVKNQLHTEVDFGFVLEYFKKLFIEIKSN